MFVAYQNNITQMNPVTGDQMITLNGIATNTIQSIAISPSGDLFIVDGGAFMVKKVNVATGVTTPFAGNGTNGTAGDGGAATAAQLSSPNGIAFDSAGNMFIGSSVGIRRVDAVDNKISTVNAVTNVQDIVSRYGLLYWASNTSVTGRRVYKLDLATNVVEVVAGNGTNGTAGDDGPATEAQLSSPNGIAFDSAGNMFIGSNDSSKVRRVDALTGIITTVPGT
jgi:sugar lactone lactonase YvrE